MPLVGAIAGGNVVCLKVSDQTPNVKQIIKKILSVFDSNYIYIVGDSKEERDSLFDLEYDYVFYTGSQNVAIELASKQAKYLTPMTLELGGKSPCIVDEECDLEHAARRIVWGKFLNAGQTCVAPDYICVHSSIKDKFIELVLKYIKEFYYEGNKLSDNFVSLINEKQVIRVKRLLEKQTIIFGGNFKKNTLEPTVLSDVSFDSEIMQEEIFAPIMPIITYHNISELMDNINKLDKPLAFYFFSKNKKKSKAIMSLMSYGGGCVNDVIMHLSEEKLPFGGVGKSGMNSYHGKKSYEIFTHSKSILVKNPKIELNFKYDPHSDKKLKLSKMFFRIKRK